MTRPNRNFLALCSAIAFVSTAFPCAAQPTNTTPPEIPPRSLSGADASKLDSHEVGASLQALEADGTTIEGGEFRLDGVLIPGLENPGDNTTIIIPADKTFSGVLSDGSVFAIRGEDGDPVSITIELIRTTLPTFAPVVDIPSDPVPPGVRGGQVLNVDVGAILPEFYASDVGSLVNVDGGEIGRSFEAIGSEVNVSSGIVRRDLDLFLDSKLNVSGGSVGDSGSPGQVFDTSSVEVTGGSVGSLQYHDQSSLHASAGYMRSVGLFDNSVATIEGTVEVDGVGVTNQASATISSGSVQSLNVSGDGTLNVLGGQLGQLQGSDNGQAIITGGHLYGGLKLINSNMIELSGGKLGGEIDARAFSTLEFHGSEFRLDGVLVSNLDNLGDSVDVVVPHGSVLSGVLSDGEMFALDGRFDRLEGTIRLRREATAPVTNTLIEVPTDPAPSTIRTGQTLILRDGGELPRDFGAHVGSNLQIEGGTVGFRMEAVGAEISMSGGMVDSQAHLYAGSTLELSGGRINSLFLQQYSHMTVNGGEIHSFDAYDNSTVEILNGEVDATADLYDNAELDFSGGFIDRLDLFDTATARLSGDITSNQFATHGNSFAEISGGTIARIRPRGNSSILFTEGTASEYLEVSGTASATISGQAAVARLISTDDAHVLMTGGYIERYGSAEINATIDLAGGHIGDSFAASTTATVNYSGGSFGDIVSFRDSSKLNISGGEFFVDGVPVSGLDTVGRTVDITLSEEAVLSGLASDGTVFAFSSSDNDLFEAAITLTKTTLPPVGGPTSDPPGGLRAGQIVSLGSGGVIPSNRGANVGSQLTANGVEIGDNFEVVAATVDVMSSQVGDGFDAFLDSTVNFVNSNIGNGLQAFHTSHVSVTGGELGTSSAHGHSILDLETYAKLHLAAYDNSTVNVTGGYVQAGIGLFDHARLNVYGGDVGSIDGRDEAVVTIDGGRNIFGLALTDNAVAYFQGEEAMAQRTWLRGNATMFVSDGFVGPDALIEGQSTVHMTGGRFGAEMLIGNTATLHMSGGSLGREVEAVQDGKIVLYGGDFQLDGVPIASLNNTTPTPVDVAEGSLISGTLADGTPFAYFTDGRFSDRFESGSLQLQLAPITAGQANINVTSPDAPTGIHAGQTMVVGLGGVVPDDFQVGAGSVLEVNQGQVGDFVDAVGATINLEAGSIGMIDAYLDTKINVNGGVLRSDVAFDPILRARHNTMISVDGGIIDGEVYMYDQSSLVVRDGELQKLVHMFGNHSAEFRGGLAHRIIVEDDSQILIDGGEIGQSSRLLGASTLQLISGRIGNNFGAYADTTFEMHGGEVGDGFGSSGIVNVFGGSIGINSGMGATGLLNVEGGTIGAGFRIRSTANLSGGTFDGIEGLLDSEINILGTAHIKTLALEGDATVNMSGGMVYETTTLSDRATFNLWGGEFSSPVGLFDNTTINLHGGSFSDAFFAVGGTAINLYGREFFLNGLPILALEDLGDSFVIGERDGALLTGTLEDGSPFELHLSTVFNFDSSYIDPEATVTVVYAVPEPSSVALMMFGLISLMIGGSRCKLRTN